VGSTPVGALMNKEEYGRYKDRINNNTSGKSPYGQPCLVCGGTDHVQEDGIEYRIERYKFHTRLVRGYQRVTKGTARRFFICGDCWEATAGSDYSMEW